MEGKAPVSPNKIKEALPGVYPAPEKRIPKAIGIKQAPKANATATELLPSVIAMQSLMPASSPPEKKKYRNECNRSILSLDSLFYPVHVEETDIHSLSSVVL